MFENRSNNAGRSGNSAAKRPMGFRSVKSAASPTAQESSAPNIPKQKPVRKVSKPKHKTSPDNRNPRNTKQKARFRMKDLLLAFACAAVVIALILGLILLLNNGKTVHQMPTILRITEEPTQEPPETAMLRAPETDFFSGAIPSISGIYA